MAFGGIDRLVAIAPTIIASPSPLSGWAENFHLQAAELAQHTAKPLRGRSGSVQNDATHRACLISDRSSLFSGMSISAAAVYHECGSSH
jgi:hypothetical protein